MKYYLIAGEQSGDLHASNLVKAIRKEDPDASFRAVGGEYLEAAGVPLAFHYKEMAVMGLVEVVMKLRTVKRYLARCKEDLAHYEPDVLIPVDFAGFNLRIAKYAKGLGMPVYYYISPKVWAWNESRIHKIRRYVDHMFAILPFEEEYFKSHGIRVDYVGNPVVDAVESYQLDESVINELRYPEPLVAILPGSRDHEIKRLLPVMLEVASKKMDHHFVVAGISSLSRELYLEDSFPQNVTIVFDKTYEVLSAARAAIVTSGTATLETALWGVPQVMGYMTHPITYLIGNRLVKLDMYSLVNLIYGDWLIAELIQKDFTDENVIANLNKILPDGEERDAMLEGYKVMRERLGDASASNRAAAAIWRYLQEEVAT